MNTPTQIRAAEPHDAVALNALMIGLSEDSDNLLYGANEVPSIGRLERMIEAEGSDYLYLAEIDGNVVGYAGIRRGHLSRVRHVGKIALGVAREQRRRGIGMSLVNHVIDLSEELGLARLELRVSTDNLGAVALYERAGFLHEGTARGAAVVRGRTIDKFYMALCMSSSDPL